MIAIENPFRINRTPIKTTLTKHPETKDIRNLLLLQPLVPEPDQCITELT